MPADSPGQVTLSPSGWWLPKEDTYFKRFLPQFQEGLPPKKNGFMREHLLEAFKYVRKWDVAVDVGSHVGFWAYDMALRFKTVWCFEPAKHTYECLARNLAEFNNVIAYNVAVGAAGGRATMHNDNQRPGNTGSAYVQPDKYGDVGMIALDEAGISKCDFLKIDVEGYELYALKGAAELIASNRPVISMECTDRKFRGRYSIEEGSAERWLIKHGYREAAAMRPDKVFVPYESV
jgi:FkbM family methyltransferase